MSTLLLIFSYYNYVFTVAYTLACCMDIVSVIVKKSYTLIWGFLENEQ